LSEGGNQRKSGHGPTATRGSASAKHGGISAGIAAGLSAEYSASAAPAVRLGWQAAITATVSGLGYELVDVERGQRGLLRVYIDRIAGRSYLPRGATLDGSLIADDSEFITVDDCEKVTRQLQYALEVEGLDYARLEVSSPGLDRPLKREADYQRFAGQSVQLMLKLPFQGRKSWQGVLAQRALGGGWSLELDGGNDSKAAKVGKDGKDGKTEQVLNFTFDEVREARLLPVVDFKGRRSGASARDGGGTGAVAADQAASPAQDGG